VRRNILATLIFEKGIKVWGYGGGKHAETNQGKSRGEEGESGRTSEKKRGRGGKRRRSPIKKSLNTQIIQQGFSFCKGGRGGSVEARKEGLVSTRESGREAAYPPLGERLEGGGQ